MFMPYAMNISNISYLKNIFHTNATQDISAVCWGNIYTICISNIMCYLMLIRNFMTSKHYKPFDSMIYFYGVSEAPTKYFQFC